MTKKKKSQKISESTTEETTTVIAKQLEKETGIHWELCLSDAYSMMMTNQVEYNRRLVTAGYLE